MIQDSVTHSEAPVSGIGVFIVFSGIFTLLVARHYGMYPTVMLDEYVHSAYARHVPFSEMDIPGYLYSGIYYIVNLFGDRYLEAARILNALFFVLGGYFTFRTACLYVDRGIALFVGGISLLLPVHFFTSLFMPDSMFYGLFWVFNYFILANSESEGDSRVYIYSGILLGLLALVKPHALFLIPVYSVYFIYQKGWSSRWLANVLPFILSTLLTKLIISLMLAGKNGFTLFGGTYTEHASSAINESIAILDATTSIVLNVIGNLVVILVYFAIPIACLIRNQSLGQLTKQEKSLVFLACLLILYMVALVSVFSTTATIFDDNIDQRLYLRYYSFAFPMLLIISAWSLEKGSESVSFSATYAAMFMAIMILIPAYYHTRNPFFYPFKAFITDSPEFYLLAYYPLILYVMSIFIALGVVYWVFKPQHGTKFYLFATLPLIIVTTWFANHDNLRRNYQADPFDLAGEYVQNNVAPTDEKVVTFVTYHEHKAKKAMMHMRTHDAKILIVSPFDNRNVISWPDSSDMIIALDSIRFSVEVDLVWSEDRVRVYKRKYE